ncbi:MAG: glycosyltransferase [Polyangiales bacterium]
MRESREPLQLTYFGRLEYYKGIQHAIMALSDVNDSDLVARLTIVGTGDYENELREVARQFDRRNAVEFLPPMTYGESFLKWIRTQDVLLAPSLAPDTPRNAWDAIASGVPILAYNTEYYDQLASTTGCVRLCAWNDIHALAEQIRDLSKDRAALVAMKSRCRDAALANTQETWLRRRVEWTNDLFDSNGA